MKPTISAFACILLVSSTILLSPLVASHPLLSLQPRDASSTPSPSLHITLTQSLFDELDPVVENIFIENINTLKLDDMELVVPVPVVGDIKFSGTGFKVSNFKLDSGKTGVKAVDGKLDFGLDGLSFTISTDFFVIYGSKKLGGTVNVDVETSVDGAIMIKNNGRGGLKAAMENVKAQFTKFDITVPNTQLNWVMNVLERIFGGLVKNVLAVAIQTLTKEVLPPVVNLLLQNQLSLGIGLNGFGASISPVFVGEPTISAANGVEVAIGLKVDQ
ncbi:hypothetical protein HK102_002057 [Quaeritorhiza haematococci]|nr:hypothetical protein HK102_002057 [Quaeritorhiza haematococci]